MLLEKKMQKSDLDLAALGKNATQLTMSARDASSTCMDVMTWLSPLAGDMVVVATGVEDAAGLLITELSFKGFTVINRIDDRSALVPRSLTRNVFIAAVIALTDSAKAPANVVLESAVVGGELVLKVSIETLQGEPPPNESSSYRNLDWEDVLALANSDSVKLSHTACSVELGFALPLVRYEF